MKVFAVLLALFAFSAIGFSQASDAALRRITESDRTARKASGELPVMNAAEHLSRAETYMANRLFPQAREHWAIVLENYPEDAGIPKALFGTARSYMWERDYPKAVEWFDKLTKDHLMTKDGREGLAFKGASYVRMGKNLEAVKAYEQYTVMFPQGERIESAHLNIIDALREAGKYDDANQWVLKTTAKFSGKPTAVNALHAKLRMDIYRERWNDAITTADDLLGRSFGGSMATADEVRYLRAFAQGKGSKSAGSFFSSITPSPSSYFSGLAAERVSGPGVKLISSVTPKYYSDYPVQFQSHVLREGKKRGVDPRFLLAIMKQESSFRSAAKSPAGARGLLQLVFDTAIKFNKQAGYPNLRPDDLYDPATNIAIGAEYIKFLKDEFGGLYEGIAASYNGGEDNALRWLARSKPKDPGIFTAEIGFAETKNYVYKVMTNYRVYRELYDENLNRR
jgi:soluble lytic murein transglycosylase